MSAYATLVLALAAISTAVVLALYWRGRPSYGTSRGMPPGSLALFESLKAITDRDWYLKAARRYGPVFKMSQFHRPTICIIGLERGHRLFREHREAFGPVSQPFNRSVAGGFLRYMDNSTHGQYARLFNRALAMPVLDKAAPDVDAGCRLTLHAMAEDCPTGQSAGLAPRKWCEQISHDAFLRVLFGLSPGTPAYDEMNADYAALKAYRIGKRVDRSTAKSLERLRCFLRNHAQTLTDARGNAPACTLTELHRLDPAMPDAVCVDNLLFILKISSANVSSLLLWIIKMLGEHRDWVARLEEQARSGDGQTQTELIDGVIRETLRLAQSEYLYRRLREDVEFEGMTLPKGWLVRLCVRESHLNEAAFENPGHFDPQRFLGTASVVREYAPFGYGAHACNGIALNDLICRAFVKNLTGGFDWRITQDGPPEREFRHWSHWQPASALRMSIRVREQPVGHVQSA